MLECREKRHVWKEKEESLFDRFDFALSSQGALPISPGRMGSFVFGGNALAPWLKLDTGILNHRKIRLIRNHPEGDSLFVLWVGLLCLGMEQESEALYIAGDVPYRVDDIATTFDLPQKTVELGLSLFHKYDMISVLDDGAIFINSLAERQTIEKLTKKREDGHIRQIRFREKQRLLTCNALLTHCEQESNKREEEVEVEVEVEEDKEKSTCQATPDTIPYSQIIKALNETAGTRYTAKAQATRRLIHARWNEGYRLGDFEKVIHAKWDEWKGDDKMVQYIRPATLFGTKFESYLQKIKPVLRRGTMEVVSEG